MLTPELVERIRRLLADGRMTQRGIARELRVSRGTVDAIAHGRRSNDAVQGRGWTPSLETSAGPIERCPGCGVRVRMPCLACRLRTLQQFRRRPICQAPEEL
jgi:DNA-binding XRE family transcriptional regulator